ncbi:hypothetical protein QJS66_02435 [Kocuria rhizophila]|nr:hypothetical protein QJS66_02435 [Kocuria rhizophila]
MIAEVIADAIALPVLANANLSRPRRSCDATPRQHLRDLAHRREGLPGGRNEAPEWAHGVITNPAVLPQTATVEQDGGRSRPRRTSRSRRRRPTRTLSCAPR